jgi:putative membrane protein
MSLSLFAQLAVILVIVLHICFMILEMFLWDKPIGLKVFSQGKEQASQTRVLAANQGLYNGFLAAGLIWGLVRGSHGIESLLFFLTCILIAGIFGALSVKRSILYIQALPAAIALILIHFS